MASLGRLLPLGEWTQPYNTLRQVNTVGFVDANPTSTNTAQQGSFICKGCETLRTVTVVTTSDLNEDDEELSSMYPWMLTLTKTCIVTNEEITKATYKHSSTIVGYMCRGCAFFFEKTGLNIRVVMENRSIKLLKIERLYRTIQNEPVIVNVGSDIDPLTYLGHLRDNPTYEALFQLEGDIPQTIEEQCITTLPQLVNYARTQTNQPS